MTGRMLHLIKLAVGVRDPAHLRDLQQRRTGTDPPLRHLTRHMPRRADEILDGGSLYWVVTGSLLVRQRIVAITPSTRADGSACAMLAFDPALIPVSPRPVKAFQGWRYLPAHEAPVDLSDDAAAADLPVSLAQRLRELCLL